MANNSSVYEGGPKMGAHFADTNVSVKCSMSPDPDIEGYVLVTVESPLGTQAVKFQPQNGGQMVVRIQETSWLTANVIPA